MSNNPEDRLEGLNYLMAEMKADIDTSMEAAFKRFMIDLEGVRDQMTRHVNRMKTEVARIEKEMKVVDEKLATEEADDGK